MSSDIYANQDLSKTVRYNRRGEEDGAEWKEMEMDIYMNEGNIRDYQSGFQPQEGGPHSPNHPPVHRKSFRGAALCLGVLCLLMMTMIIILSIHYISVSSENEQLQIRFNNLSNSYNLLQDSLSDVSVNYSQLQNRYETLNKTYKKLQDEVKNLKLNTQGKLCPEGWKRFGCSCYFKSTEKKTWFDSRYNCQRRGSDLVIINSKEEQEFVTKLNMNEESWIGLKTKVMSGLYIWEWVDGSMLTETSWTTGLLQDPNNWYFAACCEQNGKWTQSINFDNQEKNWICEKKDFLL